MMCLINHDYTRHVRHLRYLLLLTIMLVASACSTGYYDGMRVANRASLINMSGYITQPGSSGAEVRVYALNTLTNGWEMVQTTKTSGTISNSVSWTMKDNTKLYYWNIGKKALALKYWKAGTGGHFARIRAEWYRADGTRVARLYNSRDDQWECYTEDRNGEANTLAYIIPNCFSHRGQSYIYTAGYREGPATCPQPLAWLPKKHGHYRLHHIPSCARDIVYNRMAEKIDGDLIDDHYEINHGSAANAHSLDAVGTSELGGFFGGHQNYLRAMERHVMVYDYPWMPKGKIPSWLPNTTIPVPFRTAVASPAGNCNSQTAGCNGWLSGNVANPNPGIATPANLQPGAVCGFATTAALHGATNGWHGGVHGAVGNAFGTFDSPSFPLFFLWHNHIQDIWLDWKACGNPGP